MRSLLQTMSVLVLVVSFSCGSQPKTDTIKSEKLNELVSERFFEISSDWAMPRNTASLNSLANAGLLQPGSNASQISLIGNPNYLKFEEDSVSAYLPYFGERQMGGGYNSNGNAIQFKGVPKDLNIITDEKKLTKRIVFDIKHIDNTEIYNISITLFPNLTSLINVNSSQRFSIQYSGRVRDTSETTTD